MRSVFAPAKLNLFLAITGRRADGFHDLLSVVVKLDFGDTLHFTPAKEFTLRCDAPDVPLDDGNLVLKAAAAFVRHTGWQGGADFELEKRIPTGAGLGGGSSDAVAALRALDEISAGTYRNLLPQIAAEIGSDCPLFLADGPAVMRGRGERVDMLPPKVAARLRGQRVLVFKPPFGIATPWAYGALAATAPQGYLASNDAEARLARWLNDEGAPLEALLFNNMEPPAFAKFVALPTLLERLRAEFGLAPRMSGSGSACFALLPNDADVRAITQQIKAAWGEAAFVIEALLQ